MQTERTITLERRRKSRRKTKAASRDIREPAHADYVMFVMDEIAAVPGAAWRLLASDNQTTRCEHDWQVEGINLRRDSTGVLECSKCGSRQEDVVLTDDQIWRFISDHVIG